MALQRVVVDNGGLTYLAEEPVNVGDLLLLPATPMMYENYYSKVIAIGSDYAGYCKQAIDNLGSEQDICEREIEHLQDKLKANKAERLDLNRRLREASEQLSAHHELQEA